MGSNYYTVIARGLAQMRRYGPGLLLHRYVTRPRILQSTPVACPDDAAIEVHTMVCRRDWLNGVWTLKSFRAMAGQPFRLVIFEDGSLGAEARQRLREHFPGATLPTFEEMAPLVRERVAPLAPTVAGLWESRRCFILRKPVDSWLCARQRFILKIDPDVLFFRRPDELLDPATTLGGRYAAYNMHAHMAHRDGMYCVEPDRLKEEFGIDLPVGFNEGLGVMDTTITDWPLIERIFAALPLQEDLFFLMAQTIEGIFCVKHGFRPLPTDRYNVEHEDVAIDERTVARHYLAKMRDRLYVEGIPRLLAIPEVRKLVMP